MKRIIPSGIALASLFFIFTFILAEDPPFMNEVKDPNLRISLRTYGKTNVTQVANLILNANRITDIRPIRHLTQLTRLEMYNNWISDIRPLSNLVNLNKLYLGRNRIKDVSPLRNLKNLAILDIHQNELKNIDALGDLPALKELDIRGMGVTVDSFADWKFENNLQIYYQTGKFIEIATNEKDKWAIHDGLVEPAQPKAVVSTGTSILPSQPSDTNTGSSNR